MGNDLIDSSLIHASVEEPPNETLISPIGTLYTSYSFFAKK